MTTCLTLSPLQSLPLGSNTPLPPMSMRFLSASLPMTLASAVKERTLNPHLGGDRKYASKSPGISNLVIREYHTHFFIEAPIS